MPSGSISHQTERPDVNKRHANAPTNSPDRSRSFEEIMTARSKPLYGITPFRANMDNRLTSFEFRVFSTMCGFANNETHLCWPKQKTLAGLLHTSVSQISQTIARLVEYGYVEIQKIGFPARNVYRIIWEIPQKSAENIFPNIGETADNQGDAENETCLPATEFTVGETQTLPASKHRVYRGVKSLNIPIKQTNGTSSSEDSLLPTSLAQRADSASPTVTAPPERRTRERFDSSALRRDPLYIALAEHLPAPQTFDEWRTWAAMIGRLHRIQVSAADIPTAVKGYGLLYPNAVMTIRALVNQWAHIREGKTREQVAASIRNRNTAQAERAAQDRRREQRGEYLRLVRDTLGLGPDDPLPPEFDDAGE